ncbi:MAG: spore germination protein [Halanaerobiaceae bacterium]
MLNRFMRLLKYFKLKSLNNENQNEEPETIQIPSTISDIKKNLEKEFSGCGDVIYREILIGDEKQIRALLVFTEGLTSKELLNRDVLNSLLNVNMENITGNFLNTIKEKLLSTSGVEEVCNLNDLYNIILSGDAILFVEGYKQALKLAARGWESRGVQKPDTEAVVRGPREGFTETINTNIALIRRKLKNSNLKLEKIVLGKQTNTDVAICYISGIVPENILKAVRRRLKRINTDAILESGYIEEFIEDAPMSIFPTVGNSEKPDIVAAKLLEGRVAILTDGTPIVLTVPRLFVENIQASEDYYSRASFTIFVRMARILAIIISVSLPAFYVALVSFHQDTIPFKLVLSMAASSEGIPFSPFVEAFVMGVIFELLREAGVRMPRPIGQAVSIVGGLVLGQAAVEAGITSNIMVIITALTAITSFVVPSFAGTLPIIRLALLLSANILGFFGMMLTTIIFLSHMCTLRSFGVPYLAPFSPLIGQDIKDTFIRVPIWAMVTRPASIIRNDKDKNNYRMKVDIRTKED